MAAFDIGGTRFRAALVDGDGNVDRLTVEPAISHAAHPDLSAGELQERLVSYLIDRARDLLGDAPAVPAPRVGISLGAALDQRDGRVLASGPLWGAEAEPFDLLAALRESSPDLQWSLVNDVTAALLRHLELQSVRDCVRVALVTVSSGVGERTYDLGSDAVPLAVDHGLQGEIGHAPATCLFRGQRLSLPCDCGGVDHLGSFCSGRGIERVLSRVAEEIPAELAASALNDGDGLSCADLSRAVDAGDPLALEILAAVVAPLAQGIVWMLTVDPQIERVIVTGGVAHGLGPAFHRELTEQVEALGIYQVTDHDETFVRDRVILGIDDDLSGILGAARHARGPSASSAAVGSWRVQSTQRIGYDLREVDGVLDPASQILATIGDVDDSSRRFVVIDSKVDDLYGPRAREYFAAHGIEARFLSIETSEATKEIDAVLDLVGALAEFGLDRRREPVIAIGGGVLLDIAGLASNLYKRGVPYVRVPTTLLAVVDAGVGVKTAVNSGGQKSRIGTYYPPVGTLVDQSFLVSQSARQVANGMAEILKIGIVKDRRLFELVEARGRAAIEDRLQGDGVDLEIIRLAIGAMAEEIASNVWEADLERLVDFGHTFSTRVEMNALPNLLHGEAVAIDMALSTRIAADRGLLGADERRRILGTIEALGLPTFDPSCPPEEVVRALHDTAIHRAGRQRVPLPVDIGEAIFVEDLDDREVLEAWQALGVVRQEAAELASPVSEGMA